MIQYDLICHSCHESQVQIWRKTNEIGEFYTFLAEQLVNSVYHSQNAPESNRKQQKGIQTQSLKIYYFIRPGIIHDFLIEIRLRVNILSNH